MPNQGKWFDHIMIIMCENETDTNVLKNGFLSNLRSKGVYLSNNHGCCHPSQPNYIATIAGSTLGFPHTKTKPGTQEPAGGWNFAGDNVPQQVSEEGKDPLEIRSIVDLLEDAGLTWRAYIEDLPGSAGRGGSKTDLGAVETDQFTHKPGNQDAWYYLSRHNPFISFPRITRSRKLDNVVDASELAGDIFNGRLPNFSWYTPDRYNDGHGLPPGQNTTANENDPTNAARVGNISAWFEQFLNLYPIISDGEIQSVFPPRTLMVFTFDEDGPYTEENQIYTLLLGQDVLDNISSPQTGYYNHYNLLRTIEDNFNLGTLGRNDESSEPYSFFAEPFQIGLP